LGLNDYEKPGLIKRMDVIHTDQLTIESIKALYKNVFRGLGKLGQYHITLQSDYKPVVCPPRHVPYSLNGWLRKAIEANVKSGVLVKVDQPTDWVHNLAIVEKSGSLCYCFDPRAMNEVIKREQYRILTIQKIASEFAEKKVCSTLNLKVGYWKVKINKESSLLCTFNTPYGCYCLLECHLG